MDSSALEELKRHYAFDQWAGRSRTAQRLFVLDYDLTRHPTGGGTMQSVRKLATVPAGEVLHEPVLSADATVVPPPPPKATRLFWRPEGTGEDVVVDVQIFECVSRAAAHELLLVLLGAFQSPALVRRDDLNLADVCFTTPRDAAILFVRGNLVHLLRNAGRRAVPLLDVAATFDAPLAQTVADTAQRAKSRKKAKPVQKGQSVPLRVTETPLAAAVEFVEEAAPAETRVIAQGGEVYWDGTTLSYLPDEEGQHEVIVQTVATEDGAETETLRFSVS